MARGNPLLPQLRSRNHEWLLRAAQVGGAIVVGVGVPGGALLAATHPKYHSTAWTIALVVVVALAAVGIAALLVGGVGAFLTRPVPPEHADTLRASALALGRALESDRVCDYGNAYKPDQAFRAHFPRLGERLAAWDTVVAAPAVSEQALDQRLDAIMAEHEVTAGQPEVIYNLPKIKRYAHTLAIERAHGRLLEPSQFVWGEATTAINAGDIEILGPPFGVRLPFSGEDWITVTPLEGETKDDWLTRTEPYTQQVDAVMDATFASALPYAQAVLEAQERLREFKRDELPATLDALQLVQVREAPRVRHRCDSC
jgi:hypothetical protein